MGRLGRHQVRWIRSLAAFLAVCASCVATTETGLADAGDWRLGLVLFGPRPGISLSWNATDRMAVSTTLARMKGLRAAGVALEYRVADEPYADSVALGLTQWRSDVILSVPDSTAVDGFRSVEDVQWWLWAGYVDEKEWLNRPWGLGATFVHAIQDPALGHAAWPVLPLPEIGLRSVFAEQTVPR